MPADILILPTVHTDWQETAEAFLARFVRDWSGDAVLAVTELARSAHRLGDLDDAALARNRAPLAAMRRLLDEAVRRADHHAEEGLPRGGADMSETGSDQAIEHVRAAGDDDWPF